MHQQLFRIDNLYYYEAESVRLRTPLLVPASLKYPGRNAGRQKKSSIMTMKASTQPLEVKKGGFCCNKSRAFSSCTTYDRGLCHKYSSAVFRFVVVGLVDKLLFEQRRRNKLAVYSIHRIIQLIYGIGSFMSDFSGAAVNIRTTLLFPLIIIICHLNHREFIH